jgi:hypothetical protein
MWPVIEIFRSHFFLALSLLQSLIYTAGSIWFVDEISRTRASKASYLLAWFLAFNPTLSLNTIAIGYELPVVAMLLISTAALLRYFSKNKTGLFSVETLVASAAFSLATLMQPRLLVIAFAFFVLWSLAKYKLAMIAPFLALTMGIVSLAPVLMVYRNSEVHGYTAISTNLGVTMRLGAGPTAPGGYSNTGSGSVECPETSGNAAEIDRALVNCVIKWYLNNPLRSVELFWNKARYFWSPWFGPEVNGTMAHSPWNLNHPLRSAAQTEEGFNFIFGPVGKFVSWLWMLLSLAFLVKGFLYLWRFGDLERLIGLSAGLVFFVNLVSSMLTIGDNRFRIPTMGLSLFLQAVGLASLYANQRLKNERAEPVVAWPMLKSPNSNKDES